MKSSLLNQYICLCEDVLSNMDAKISKPFKKFILDVLILYVVIPKKINFLQIGRYSEYGEQRFRQNFTKDFDWFKFNATIAYNHFTGKRKAIAIDPSFIKKSGKKTPYIGRFWSGCDNRAMRGLEILGVGVIDADDKDCISLNTVQTPDSKTLKMGSLSLTDWYLFALEQKREELIKISKHFVADAWFAKSTFVNGLKELDFHLISRFRDDAHLMYIYKGVHTGKKGRPKRFDGKIDFANVDRSKFDTIHQDKDTECLTSVVYAKALGMNVRVVIAITKKNKKHTIYFSTDTELKGIDVLELYKTRFQIEFNFRDAKQHTGLTDSQSRDIKRMNFNFNTALATINLVKLYAKQQKKPYSIASVKVMMHNAFLLERFIAESGIQPNNRLNAKLFKELIEFAAIAA